MALDLDKLENVKQGAAGKITARCPACAKTGGDKKGEHLVVYPDGAYGCAAHPKDKAHSKAVHELVGGWDAPGDLPVRVTVNAFVAPESKTIMDLSHYERFKRKVWGAGAAPDPRQESTPPPTAQKVPDAVPGANAEKSEAHRNDEPMPDEADGPSLRGVRLGVVRGSFNVPRPNKDGVLEWSAGSR